jgi:predicted HicB family RNase H-like nuclease
MLQYKGYVGKVEFDDESMLFHGEILGMRDVVTFQGTTVKELEKAFRDSIDDYLAFCKEREEEPDKPFTGKFVVRLAPELHRAAFIAAKRAGKSLNNWLSEKVERAIRGSC